MMKCFQSYVVAIASVQHLGQVDDRPAGDADVHVRVGHVPGGRRGVILPVVRIIGYKEGPQQPGCQIAARRDSNPGQKGDAFSQIQACCSRIIVDHSSKHVRVDLADEDVQTRSFQVNRNTAFHGISFEGHPGGARRPQQAGDCVNRVRAPAELDFIARVYYRQRLCAANRPGGVFESGSRIVGDIEFDGRACSLYRLDAMIMVTMRVVVEPVGREH